MKHPEAMVRVYVTPELIELGNLLELTNSFSVSVTAQ